MLRKLFQAIFLSACFFTSTYAPCKTLNASELTQNFPDKKKRLSNLYSINFMRFLQIVYGSEDILSQGGIESVKDMFSGISLEGKRVLDVGCGFGGVDTYLASRFNVKIVGVDKEPYMVLRAKEIMQKSNRAMKGSVSFQPMESAYSLNEFPDASFDVVFTKEVFYHVPNKDKQSFLNEMSRVLKPGGMLIASEWICAEVTGQRLKDTLRVEGFCNFVTARELQDMMRGANFSSVSFRDVTRDHYRYAQEDLDRIYNARDVIAAEFGQDFAQRASDGFKIWQKAMEEPSELISGIFVGSKDFQ